MKLLLLGLIVTVFSNNTFGESDKTNDILILGLATNSVYEGEVRFQVRLTMTNSQDISGVYLLLDGQSSPSIQDPPAPLTQPIIVEWNTAQVSNGWHTLQAFAEYPTGRNEDGGYEQYTGQVVRVQTFNPIVWKSTLSTFGNKNTGAPFAFPIQATSSIATTQWKATISTLSNKVLRVLTGVTTNGSIETNWDGKDASGFSVKENLDSFEVDVETIPTNAPPIRR